MFSEVMLKGHGRDFGQILFLQFYYLQYFSNAFPMIYQHLSISRRVISRIQNSQLYTQGSCHFFLFISVYYTSKSSFLSRFFILLINFEHKLIVPSVWHISLGLNLEFSFQHYKCIQISDLRFVYITKNCELIISVITWRRHPNLGWLLEMPNRSI